MRSLARLLVLGALLASPLAAQPAAQLSGTVTQPGSTPVVGARVQVTVQTGQSFETHTDTAGRYQIRLPAGSGGLVVSVEAPGLRPATRLLSDPHRTAAALTLDFALELPAVKLDRLVVRAPRLSVAEATRWTPGSAEQASTGMGLRQNPLATGDASELAARKVGVAQSATADGVGLSIAGQAPDQTRLSMDGAGIDGVVIPREAIGAVSVTGNAYDVARGRYTGGQVDVQTQRAGNPWGATLRLDGSDRRLQYGDAPESFRRRSSHLGLDAGGGGALVRDRLFAYGALTLRQTESPTFSLGNLDARELGALGISADSVARFLELTRPMRPEPGRPSGQGSDLGSGMLRLDAVLSARHSLMLRLNEQRSHFSDPGSAWNVAGTGAALDGVNRGVLAQLSSGGKYYGNDLRLHLAGGASSWSRSDPVPEGVVTVTSDLQEGGYQFAELRFAGGTVGGDTRQQTLELADEFVLTTPDGKHRLRAGAEVGAQEYSWMPGAHGGRFEFASLAELERGRPARFTRSLATAERDTEQRRAAFFLDDLWRAGPLQLSYGVRGERSWYPDPVETGPAVEARFGRAPGVMRSPLRVSPRLGFSFEGRMPWDRGPYGRSTIQGGIGEFVGVLPLATMSAALSETGLADAADLVCAGPAAPTPDWAAYRTDPRTIPTACADGSPSFSSRLPRATLFATDFGPPRVWRASLNGQGVLHNQVLWSFHSSLLLGVRQPVAFDRNLRESPGFLASGEGGRPVYVTPDAVDPTTGAVSLTASRKFPELGVVREVTGEGRSRTVQLGASANQFFGLTKMLDGGYTWTYAREMLGPLRAPTGSAPSTAGDPSALTWAPAGYTPRHMLYASAQWTPKLWISLGAQGRLSSGVPFTPMVAGDVNGDGAANDRAFIFDPKHVADVDAPLAQSMAQFLSDAPAGVRTCLRSQLDRIAAHNSCWTGWSPSLDLHARFRLGPQIGGSHYRRVLVWLVARNVTAGLDYLLHGQNGLRGWGQLPAVDNRLLSVRGFDPATERFRYEANPRFGGPMEHAFLQRSPFMLSIEGRFVVGNDRVLTSFTDRMHANSNRDEALAPANLRLFLERQLPNLPAEVLDLNGPRRLYLTPEQAAGLQHAADSLAVQRESIVSALVAASANPEPARPSAPRMDREQTRELSRRAVTFRQAGIRATRPLLTPEQWEKLPDPLRSPGTEFSPRPPERLVSPPPY